MNHTFFPLRLLIAFGMLLAITPGNVVGQDTVIRPLPKPGPLDNPLKGWCPYANAGEIHQPYSLVFQYISWRELEPVENQYRFEEWEQTWDSPRGQGKHVIFRVYIDYPAKPSGLPDWLRQAGVKETPYSDYRGGMAPDYDNPKLVASMERLIAALGKRYNDHPRVAFIQVGLLGFWGEWHTYPRSDLYASVATEQRVLDAYRRAFPDKSLMVRYARDYAGQQPWIGFHDDMFPEDTDNGKAWSFMAGLRSQKRTDNWKVAVVGGEMVPGKSPHWLGEGYETTVAMIDQARFTWVGPYCPALRRPTDDRFSQRCEDLVRQMGYEFCITEMTHPKRVSQGTSIRLAMSVKNRGVAPFYYPWSVEWGLIDAAENLVMVHKTDWDIRRWLPAGVAVATDEASACTEATTMPVPLPPGMYRLAIGIRDPWQDRPAIGFANDLPIVDGWTVLSELEVTP